jgi:phosphoglycolate phosphatase
MLEELLNKFALEENQALMVGDTEYDMDMAEKINMPRLAVTYGAHHADRLKIYNPIACIDCFSNIKKHI